MAGPGGGEVLAWRPGMGSVAVVTDSTASWPAAGTRSDRVAVVPLRLLAGDLVADDGDPEMAAIAAAAARGERLTTARPSPDRFAAAYREAAGAGAGAVLSVHLSRRLSGTVSSAELAAATAPIPVRVVDAQTIGLGLGLAVLAAEAAASAGQGLAEAAATTLRYTERIGSFFAIDAPDALLASGRMAGGRMAGGPSSVSRWPAVQSQATLAARTIMQIRSGQIVTIERVRTRAAAAAVLIDLAADFAGHQPVDLGVQHTAAADRAAALADRLAAAIPQVRRVYVAEAGLAIRAHTGPGMLAVTVAPLPAAR
jgi:fatty acid kinase fatty acid binding subunit